MKLPPCRTKFQIDSETMIRQRVICEIFAGGWASVSAILRRFPQLHEDISAALQVFVLRSGIFSMTGPSYRSRYRPENTIFLLMRTPKGTQNFGKPCAVVGLVLLISGLMKDGFLAEGGFRRASVFGDIS